MLKEEQILQRYFKFILKFCRLAYWLLSKFELFFLFLFLFCLDIIEDTCDTFSRYIVINRTETFLSFVN